MENVSQEIGRYAAGLRFEDLSPEAIGQARRLTMDTIGCAFGGFGCDPSVIVQGLAEEVSSKRPATILCSGVRTSAEYAAFVNDVMARYLDFNDGYISVGSGHPSDSIAALLAPAEVVNASGRDFILAAVLAYEVFCRICDGWDNKARGIDHVTIGGIATAVGTARLLELTQEQIAQAINLTVAANVALNQTRKGHITMWKACAYANASRNAIVAARLAEQGMTGPAEVFEGPHGFFKVIAGGPFAVEMRGGRGEPFRILQCSIKRFPLGQYSQTIVQAALDAREIAKSVDEIAEVNIRTLQTALTIMADTEDKWRPRSRETADHSIPYSAAVALMFGSVDGRYFEEPYLSDPRLLDLVSRVKCSVSKEANSREREMNLSELELVLKSGERRLVRSEFHRGHWRNPLSDAEVEEKFRSLVGDRLPADRLNALARQLWALEDLADIGDLTRLTIMDEAGLPAGSHRAAG